jgi:hypothetical protein
MNNLQILYKYFRKSLSCLREDSLALYVFNLPDYKT